MLVILKILRYQPEQSEKPYYETFQVKAEPTDRVLDLLENVRGDVDGTLSYRRSCAHGVCGSDAMRINGKNALACKVLVKDLGTNEITVEPLLGLKPLRDLIVDMGPFFEQYKSVMPYMINDEPEPEKERYQSQHDRLLIEDTTKCILCAACTTSCPSYWSNNKYIGPAAIVNAHRFIFDSRDRGASERLKKLGSPDGVWRCRTVFNCTLACPREIQITKAIADVKNTLRTGRLDLIEPVGEEAEGSG